MAMTWKLVRTLKSEVEALNLVFRFPVLVTNSLGNSDYSLISPNINMDTTSKINLVSYPYP